MAYTHVWAAFQMTDWLFWGQLSKQSTHCNETSKHTRSAEFKICRPFFGRFSAFIDEFRATLDILRPICEASKVLFSSIVGLYSRF